jgi:hypothetical protein
MKLKKLLSFSLRSKKLVRKLINIIVIASLLSNSAFGYVGPGLGTGVVATVLGVIFAIFLSLFSIIWYPIKRLLKKNKDRKAKK